MAPTFMIIIIMIFIFHYCDYIRNDTDLLLIVISIVCYSSFTDNTIAIIDVIVLLKSISVSLFIFPTIHRAISKDCRNAVYYCNRAAAHSKLNNHREAIDDCKRALEIEPQYSKAYGRMG